MHCFYGFYAQIRMFFDNFAKKNMLSSVNVIVLRAFMFGDTKMMVDVLSREEGRMSCVFKTGSSKRGKSRRQIFQPLSQLELTLERKTPGQLATIRDAHISTAFRSVQFDPYKLSITMFLAETLCSVTKSEQSSPTLFDYISDSIQWLDNADAGFSNFHLVFLMRLTKFIGFFPNTEDYTEGYCFDMENGCFVPFATSEHGFLNAEETKKMHALMRMNYSTMHLFRMSHTERNRCLDVIMEFYAMHVPNFGELKSIKILREIFSPI